MALELGPGPPTEHPPIVLDQNRATENSSLMENVTSITALGTKPANAMSHAKKR